MRLNLIDRKITVPWGDDEDTDVVSRKWILARRRAARRLKYKDRQRNKKRRGWA